jgi:hypothetical protein
VKSPRERGKKNHRPAAVFSRLLVVNFREQLSIRHASSYRVIREASESPQISPGDPQTGEA